MSTTRPDNNTDTDTGWAQPLYRGRPSVVAILATSALMAVVLLLPVADAPRRWVVLELLVVLIALQAVLAVRAWRVGRRPLSPLWMRVAAPSGFMWGAMTGWFYALPIGPHESALTSVLSGGALGVFSGLIMWLGDPNRPAKGARRAEGARGRSGPTR